MSVIAWLDYDAPENFQPWKPGGEGNLSLAGHERADQGAARLDAFVNGLHATHEGEGHYTALGHSYGSTVVGTAASAGDGLAVDDIVAGSPGMRVAEAGDLNIDRHHVWVGAAPDDPIVNWTAETVHGVSPANPEFGANKFHVDTHGHGDYRQARIRGESVDPPMTIRSWFPTHQRQARLRQVVIAVTLAAVLAACSDSGSPDPAKEHPLPTRDPAEASAALTAFARELHQQIAPAGKFTEVGTSDYPCEDPQGNASEDGPFSMLGNYQIFLTADQHRPVLNRLSREWKTAGWTKVSYYAFGAEGVSGELKGTRPSDETAVTLTSGKPPIALALMLSTPCYERNQ